jgi:hypothetical protein
VTEAKAAEHARPGRAGVERAAAVVLAAVACFLLLRSWQVGQSYPGIDYYQFWAVGEAIEHDGVSNPYSDDERVRMGALYLERASREDAAPRHRAVAQGRAVLETYSTPFLYTAMHAIASGDYERDFTRWHTLSLLAFVAAVVMFGRAAGVGWGGAAALLALVVAFGAPFQSETQVANVNRVQLGGLALATLLLGRSGAGGSVVLGGAVLAACATFKPNVAIAVVLVAITVGAQLGRRALLELVVGGAVSAVLCFGAAALFCGSAGSWLDWAATISLIPEEIIRVSLGNYAPLPLLLGTRGAGASLAIAALLCVPVAVALVRRSDPPASDRERGRVLVTTVGLGCVVYLATATLVWEHYFLLALPLAIALGGHAVAVREPDAAGWVRLRVLPALAFLGLLATPTYGIAGLPHEIYFPLVQGSALVIFYILGVWSLLDRVAAPASDQASNTNARSESS